MCIVGVLVERSRPIYGINNLLILNDLFNEITLLINSLQICVICLADEISDVWNVRRGEELVLANSLQDSPPKGCLLTYLVILGVEMLRKPGWAIYSMFLSKFSARTFCLAILFLLLLVFFCARTVGYAAENFVRSIRSNSHSHLSLLLKIDIFSLDFVNSGSLFQCFTTRLEKN